MHPPADAPGSNRLLHETSPYLLQHARNPVDWYPWGDEAFARARQEDKPIFLSIGYAACHWCHVMERESFEDPRIAALLNTHFVAVKVDREERPDVDGIYIQALLAIQGNAGWPANLFLLPDLRPFTGGTYMPPRPSYGMPSFRQVLERVRETWTTQRDAVERAGGQLQASLVPPPAIQVSPTRLAADGYSRAVSDLLRLADDEQGGFGSDQKFPQSPELELLLLAAFDALPEAQDHLRLTLRAMDDGGLQDQLGGGFHRYCVDRDWTVPHFEKMLYDNAQLLRLYARSSSLFAATGDKRWFEAVRADIRVARDTVHYLLRDLRHTSGAFYSSEDADDPGGEGHFYTYTPAEAREAIGGGPLPYGITENGNFESGRTVLHAHGGRPPRPIRERLLAHRDRRERPSIDDKRVVAWNGLTLGALAEAGRLFGAEEWIAHASRCAELLLDARGPNGLLPRILGGKAPGVLEDQAFVAEGLIDLYQALPGEVRWLDAALSVAEAAIAAFADPRGGFYQAQALPDLIVRRKELHDGAEPSGNGRMAEVLRRLCAYGAPIERTVLDRTLATAAGFMTEHPAATPELWSVVRALTAPVDRAPWELVIAGDPHEPRTRQLIRVWNRTWRPQGVLAVAPPGSDLGERYTLLSHRPPGPDGHPLAYACRRGTCSLPVDSPEALANLLDR
jgi:uncharacterized protein YyaL (SSP411 family)